MKNRYYIIIFIVVIGLVFSVSCKRTEYNSPDLTGPAVVDFYAYMNIPQTIIPANTTMDVTVKVLSNQGPIEGARVTFYLTNYDGTSYSRVGDIYPATVTTNSYGIATSTIYAPSNIQGTYGAKVVAHVSKDPYTNNNRILRLDTDIMFTE